MITSQISSDRRLMPSALLQQHFCNLNCRLKQHYIAFSWILFYLTLQRGNNGRSGIRKTDAKYTSSFQPQVKQELIATPVQSNSAITFGLLQLRLCGLPVADLRPVVVPTVLAVEVLPGLDIAAQQLLDCRTVRRRRRRRLGVPFGPGRPSMCVLQTAKHRGRISRQQTFWKIFASNHRKCFPRWKLATPKCWRHYLVIFITQTLRVYSAIFWCIVNLLCILKGLPKCIHQLIFLTSLKQFARQDPLLTVHWLQIYKN